VTNNLLLVDASVIEWQKMLLPREVSKATCSYIEKSAEVIVLKSNELYGMDAEGLTI
jgi:hypothetical protein